MRKVFLFILILSLILGFGVLKLEKVSLADSPAGEMLGDWESMNESLYALDVPLVKIFNGGLILSVFKDSLERSTDGGITWSKVGEGVVEGDLVKILEKDDSIFVFTKIGVFKSTDRGATWIKIWEVKDDSVSFAKRVNNSFYIGTEKGNLLKTENFKEFETVLSVPSMITDVASFNDTLFVGTIGGLFKFEEGEVEEIEEFKGRSVTGIIKREEDFVVVSNDNRVLIGDEYTSEGFIDVTKNGETFVTVNKKLLTSYNGVVSFDNGIFVFSDDTLLFSENGKEWEEYCTGLPTIYSISIDPDDSNHILLGTELGVYESMDMGRNFYQLTDGFEGLDVICTLFLKDKIYFGTDGGVLLSKNDGVSWERIGLNERNIHILINFNGKVYAGTDEGLFVFDGDTWKDAGVSGVVHTLSKGSDFIVVGTDKGVYIVDGEVKKVGSNIGGAVYSSFVKDGKIFVGTSFNESGGLFVSDDRGESWRRIEGTPGADITSIIVFDGRIIIGTWYMGIFEYKDGSWVERNHGLSDFNIKSIKKDPFKDIVYCATTKGIFYSDLSLNNWKMVGYTLKDVVINGIYLNPFKENDIITTTWLGVFRWKEYELIALPQILSIKLVWREFPKNVNINGYEIYKISPDSDKPELIKRTGPEVKEFVDRDVSLDKTYIYFIKSFDDKTPPNYYLSNIVKVKPLKDTVPPVIEISEPKVQSGDRIFLNKKSIKIKGKVTDNIEVKSLTINDKEVEIEKGGYFEYELEIEEGANSIEVVAKDTSGNEAVFRIYVDVDTTPPTIEVNLPDVSEKEEIKVEGRTEEWGNLYVNGEEILVYSDGTFSFDLKLKPGMNELKFVAKDRAGNITEKTFTVIYRIILKLQIGSKTMYINDEPKEIDVPPTIVEGRTLLPIRWVAEPLGADVGWDGKERKVIVSLNDTTIELWIGKPTARVNGIEKPIDPNNPKVVPMILNGRTMLPVRFVAENLGADVLWDGTTKTVTIIYPKE